MDNYLHLRYFTSKAYDDYVYRDADECHTFTPLKEKMTNMIVFQKQFGDLSALWK